MDIWKKGDIPVYGRKISLFLIMHPESFFPIYGRKKIPYYRPHFFLFLKNA